MNAQLHSRSDSVHLPTADSRELDRSGGVAIKLPRDGLTHFPCALCGAGRATALFTKRAYAYVKCDECELVFVNPRFADPAVANAPMQHARDEFARESDSKLRRRRKKYARRLRRLAPFRGSGRLIEIGCREGQFLSVAAGDGWDVLGIEPEAETAAVARERFGLEVHRGYLRDADVPDSSVDVVYLCEVIEHVDQPVPLMREIRRVLRPGGVVYVKTGNAASLSARRLGADWTYFAYARLGHVTYFSPETLRRLFQAAPLELVSLRSWGIELPRGLRRSILRPYVGLTGQGAHIEAIARRT